MVYGLLGLLCVGLAFTLYQLIKIRRAIEARDQVDLLMGTPPPEPEPPEPGRPVFTLIRGAGVAVAGMALSGATLARENKAASLVLLTGIGAALALLLLPNGSTQGPSVALPPDQGVSPPTTTATSPSEPPGGTAFERTAQATTTAGTSAPTATQPSGRDTPNEARPPTSPTRTPQPPSSTPGLPVDPPVEQDPSCSIARIDASPVVDLCILPTGDGDGLHEGSVDEALTQP